MTRGFHLVGSTLVAACLAFVSQSVCAQPRDQPVSPAASTELPPGIAVRKTSFGDVYVDAKGHTLYGMDTSSLFLETRTPNS